MGSCTYHNGAEPKTVCDTTYCYQVIRPIILNNCAVAGCHISGGSGTGDFSTYAGIQPYLDGSLPIRINIPDQNDAFFMPQGSSLTPADLNTLNAWLNSGHPGCY